MARKRRKRNRENEGLKLTDKHHPLLGIIATVMALLSFCVFATICILTGQNHGAATITYGFVGIICFVISIGGFVAAWISLHQENIRTLFPTIASLANGILVVFYLLLYAWGTAL